MTRYMPGELGDLQKKILKHFFLCENKKPENVSHISKELGVLQPSVYRSIDLLIKDGYLLKDIKHTVGKKELIVTEKGAAAAVLLGIDIDKLTNYLNKLGRKDSTAYDEARFFESFRGLETIKERSKQDLLVQKMMEYYLKNDYFDEIGKARRIEPGTKEFKSLLSYVAIKYHLGKPLKGIIEKYGLDKKIIKEALEEEKSRIDSIIKQIED